MHSFPKKLNGFKLASSTSTRKIGFHDHAEEKSETKRGYPVHTAVSDSLIIMIVSVSVSTTNGSLKLNAALPISTKKYVQFDLIAHRNIY